MVGCEVGAGRVLRDGELARENEIRLRALDHLPAERLERGLLAKQPLDRERDFPLAAQGAVDRLGEVELLRLRASGDDGRGVHGDERRERPIPEPGCRGGVGLLGLLHSLDGRLRGVVEVVQAGRGLHAIRVGRHLGEVHGGVFGGLREVALPVRLRHGEGGDGGDLGPVDDAGFGLVSLDALGDGLL